MKKTLFTLFAVFAMVLIGCSQPTGGDISDWENPPSEIGGGDPTDPTDPAEPENPVTKFTVTYSTDYGTVPEPITVEKDTVLTAEQLKELTFEGFVFKGWFDGETEVKAGEYKVTKDVELTAKWEKSSSTEPDPAEPENPVTKFTVTYSTDYGTVPEPITVEKDTVLTAEQLKELTFEGFVFKGWFDGETEVKVGEYKVTKNVELTAKWEKSSSTEPDPADPEDPEKSPYEELLKDIENAKYNVMSSESIIVSDVAVTYLGIDVEILTIPDNSKKLIIAKFIEKLSENGLIGYGYIMENCIVYCYTDKYFVGFKAVETTMLTSENLSKDFMIYKKSN